jgi:bacteriocin-like protein
MSEKKMTDEELAKISGAGDEKTSQPKTPPPGLPGGGGGGGEDDGEISTDAPGGDIQDFQKT